MNVEEDDEANDEDEDEDEYDDQSDTASAFRSYSCKNLDAYSNEYFDAENKKTRTRSHPNLPLNNEKSGLNLKLLFYAKLSYSIAHWVSDILYLLVFIFVVFSGEKVCLKTNKTLALTCSFFSTDTR